jgi:DnaK suppressor protein
MLNKKRIRDLHRALGTMPAEGQGRSTARGDRAQKKGYSARDLEEFKKIILSMRNEVLEDIRLLRETTRVAASAHPGADIHHHGTSFMEHAMDAASLEQNTAMMRRQTKLLGYLEGALKRIEAGNYGFCTACGILIERERLAAVPHTQLCIACKTGKPAPQTAIPPHAAAR